MTLRRESAVHVPEDVDTVKYAPLLCAGVTVFNGIRRLSVRAGELVAIQGIGGLSHVALQYAAKLGYRVAILSRGKEKESFALQLGASRYMDTTDSDGIMELQAMGGAAFIVTTALIPEVITLLTKGLQPKLLILGGKSQHIPRPWCILNVILQLLAQYPLTPSVYVQRTFYPRLAQRI